MGVDGVGWALMRVFAAWICAGFVVTYLADLMRGAVRGS